MSEAPRSPSPAPLKLNYPAELPISAHVAEIRAALEAHQVVIVAGATGSGKTTQLPKVALELHQERLLKEAQAPTPSSVSQVEGQGRGQGRRGGRARGTQIAITQPRRIAATSVAARVASELGCALGSEVGYQIRFEDRTSESTCLRFMTDGILLAEVQGDPLLRRYHCIIVDEAHERSLNIDFLLGTLKGILPRRPELRVIVSSATIETQRFSEFFDGAPVISVAGRTFPVDVLYEPPDPELDVADATADAVANIAGLDPHGDILVFLPGEREISDTERALVDRNLRMTQILPLYARLAAAEQHKVFSSGGLRRVILATNVAETSLTIPGIVYVVDTGIARLARYDARTGTTRLQVEAISQASADQRKGRCGRVREGICVRLYEEADFASRSAFTDAEVRRVGLAGVILRMKSARLGDVESFPFLDPPSGRAVAEGYRVLEELGAIDAQRELTSLGNKLARFPVDPRVARMILAGSEFGCLQEVLVLAAALEIQDPRERPRGSEQKAEQLHRRFRDEASDFAGLLKLWAFAREAHGKGSSNLRRVCKENFISHVRIREWRDVHRQLEQTVRELRLDGASKSESPPAAEAGENLHLALLSGLLSRIGQYNPEQRAYFGARQTRFVLHPSSALTKKPPAWVMAFELVETTQLFARTAAKVEPEWLDRVGGHLLKRSYSDPHWSEKSARATVREHATLFGLPVLKDRSVDYATLAPGRARLMFLEHALVRGEYKSKGAFQEQNRALLAEVARLRDKARQSDMLADDEAMLGFFDRRVPDTVVNGKTFETWREKAEQGDATLLRLRLKDVLTADEGLDPAHYPDELELYGARLPLSYRFDPLAADDGVTLTLPLALVPRVDPAVLDWTIPAWHAKKLSELLLGLQKASRRELGPIPELVTQLQAQLVPFSGPFLPALTKALRSTCGATLAETAFRLDAIPGYLRLNCRVRNESGKIVGESRDIAALLEEHGARARAALQQADLGANWGRTGVLQWDFGELPEFVSRRVLGADVHTYPALVARKSAVDLVLLDSPQEAEQATRGGVRRLVALAHSRPLAVLAKRMPKPFTRRVGLPASRAECDAFTQLLVDRTLAEACDFGAGVPRNKAQFEQVCTRTGAQLDVSAAAVLKAVSQAAQELDETLRALDKAAAQPSGAAALRDMREQLEHLFPVDVMQTAPLAQLGHYPRYLRAIRVRLARAQTDPRKDTGKLEPLLPLWRAFLAKCATPRDDAGRSALRWAFEELRVAIFAPELKPAYAVSVATVARALAALD